MNQGVILYGPPASGKDTVTAELAKLAGGYALFERVKVGSGRTAGYRMGTADDLTRLEQADEIVYANDRYGSIYVIDRPGLVEAAARGIPVVHLGQLAGIRALVEDAGVRDWVTVLLWCPRDITASRSTARGDKDTEARLAAWDATRDELGIHPNVAWDLTVPTVTTKAAETALLIDALVRGGAAS